MNLIFILLRVNIDTMDINSVITACSQIVGPPSAGGAGGCFKYKVDYTYADLPGKQISGVISADDCQKECQVYT